MSAPNEPVESVCETYLRTLSAVLQKDHHGIWDDGFEKTYVETREHVIAKCEGQPRAEVTRRFREWRKANKKPINSKADSHAHQEG